MMQSMVRPRLWLKRGINEPWPRWISLFGPLFLLACSGTFDTNKMDAGEPPCMGCTTEDCDSDSLDNAQELLLGTDPCNMDSDNDQIPDGVEVNAPKICVGQPESTTPRPLQECQTDADCGAGLCTGFDPLSGDQDGDGVNDGEEDRDRNGLIGECLADCAGGQACGQGQTCTAGRCAPVIHLDCIGAETDPRLTDTDGDGATDDKGSSVVCNTTSLVEPMMDHNTAGDWTLALDPAFGAVRAVTNTAAGPTEVAITFDDPQAQVAGIVLSKPGRLDPLKQDEADEVLMAELPGAAITAVFNRQAFKTYDGYSAATSLRLITPTVATTTGALRDQLLLALSGRTAGEVTITPGPSFGAGSERYALLITTISRPDRVILLAAVSDEEAYTNRGEDSAIRMQDLTNGTALATSGKGLKAECDDFNVEFLPMADIVWLVDDSGTISLKYALIAAAADLFFQQLQGSGIDFRVGVMRAGCGTEMVKLNGDKFTTDQAKFSADILSPLGPSLCENEAPITAGKNLYELVLSQRPAVTQAGDMRMGLRDGAKLMYVFVTDEEEYPLQEDDLASRELQQADIEALPQFQSLLSFYQQSGITAYGMIALPPDCQTSTEPSWAAKSIVEQTGGAAWPICKTDESVLSSALSALINSTQGASSTYRLSRVPVSSTIKLSLKGNVIQRAMEEGFDYSGPNNSIIFNTAAGAANAPYVGDSIFVSYRFFDDAPILE